jgi:hypothetical protein
MMSHDRFAELLMRRSNIRRYRRLLETRLTDLERQYVERRLAEEHGALHRLTTSALPLASAGLAPKAA